MDKTKQRIAIAKACGWKIEPMLSFAGEHMRDVYTTPNGICVPESQFPDYLNDLNAMHEAEKYLNEKQQTKYLHTLIEPFDSELGITWREFHATAEQRAEAFLKTLNLWEDE